MTASSSENSQKNSDSLQQAQASLIASSRAPRVASPLAAKPAPVSVYQFPMLHNAPAMGRNVGSRSRSGTRLNHALSEQPFRRKLASIGTLSHYANTNSSPNHQNGSSLTFSSLRITPNENMYKMKAKGVGNGKGRERSAGEQEENGRTTTEQTDQSTEQIVPNIDLESVQTPHLQNAEVASSDGDSITNDMNRRDYDSLLRRLAHYSPVKRKAPPAFVESRSPHNNMTSQSSRSRKRSRNWAVSRKDKHLHVRMPTSAVSTPRSPRSTSSKSSHHSYTINTPSTPRSALVPTTIPDKTRLFHDQTHYQTGTGGTLSSPPPPQVTQSPRTSGPLRRYSASSIPLPARSSSHHKHILDPKTQDQKSQSTHPLNHPMRRSSSSVVSSLNSLPSSPQSHPDSEPQIESPQLPTPTPSRRQSAHTSTRSLKKKSKLSPRMRMFRSQVVPTHGVMDLFPSTMERRMAKLQQRFRPSRKALGVPSKNNNLSVDLTQISAHEGEV
eukprot:CAMPEP_0117440754 /NCGR_PEP_ID=MMETSP0759-20121206/3260_1 /TAXON_ID=63605 /ORGANISM="Percolomonas cosmopolitus, Strain WS" /LENGTH=497 /DNA_ID=CAMNT_0005232543 /DNA_START=151 /DNA_END=1644 /DNA_ORIENTATION=+